MKYVSSADGYRLGVWAAEGFESDWPNFDLSEPHRSDFLEDAKGSRTPEITTFCGVGLLPPTLLGQFLRLWAMQCLGTFAYRFNQRFNLNALLDNLLNHAATARPTRERQIRAMAELQDQSGMNLRIY